MPTLTTGQKVAIAVSVPLAAVLLYVLLKWSKDEEDFEGEGEEGQAFATSSDMVLEVKVPQSHVGAVIGQGGSTIKQIQKESSTRINFKDDEEESDNESEEIRQHNRTILIRGSRERTKHAELLVRKVIAEQPAVERVTMEIPQRVVGRIIGKGGKTIRQLCRISGAKIKIDRDDELCAVKMCEISGTEAQIAYAKELLQEKMNEDKAFRRKEENAKEVNGAEPMFVRLPTDGDFFGVYVSALDTPGHFWIQKVTKDSKQLDELVEEMTVFYGDKGKGHRLDPPKVGDLCCSPFQHDESWYRAEVTEVINPKEVRIRYLDFGDSGIVSTSNIMELRKEFCELPFQAKLCSLANIRPEGNKWTDAARDLFEKLSYCAQWKVLMARIVCEDVGLPCIELFDTNGAQDVNIAEELVKQGYAEYTEKLPDNEPEVTSENASASETSQTAIEEITLQQLNEQFQSPGFDDVSSEMNDSLSFEFASPRNSSSEADRSEHSKIIPLTSRERVREVELSAVKHTVTSCVDVSKLPDLLDLEENEIHKGTDQSRKEGEVTPNKPVELVKASDVVCKEKAEVLNDSEKIREESRKILAESENDVSEAQVLSFVDQCELGSFNQLQPRVMEEFPAGNEFPSDSPSPVVATTAEDSCRHEQALNVNKDVVTESRSEEHLEREPVDNDMDQQKHNKAIDTSENKPDLPYYVMERRYSDGVTTDDTLSNGKISALTRSSSEVVVSPRKSKQTDEQDGKGELSSKSVGSLTHVSKGGKRLLAANFNQLSNHSKPESEKDDDEEEEDDDSLYLSAREDSDSTGFVSATGSRTNLRLDTDSDVTPSGYLSEPDEDLDESLGTSELEEQTRLDTTLLAEKLERYADK